MKALLHPDRDARPFVAKDDAPPILDRSHAHDDFEAGAPVITGGYRQHLRTPREFDARQWWEDEHVVCKPGAPIIVPPTVIHTTEALGLGRHAMLNVFAPAHGDHIKSWMVLNAKECAPA